MWLFSNLNKQAKWTHWMSNPNVEITTRPVFSLSVDTSVLFWCVCVCMCVCSFGTTPSPPHPHTTSNLTRHPKIRCYVTRQGSHDIQKFGWANFRCDVRLKSYDDKKFFYAVTSQGLLLSSPSFCSEFLGWVVGISVILANVSHLVWPPSWISLRKYFGPSWARFFVTLNSFHPNGFACGPEGCYPRLV